MGATAGVSPVAAVTFAAEASASCRASALASSCWILCCLQSVCYSSLARNRTECLSIIHLGIQDPQSKLECVRG